MNIIWMTGLKREGLIHHSRLTTRRFKCAISYFDEVFKLNAKKNWFVNKLNVNRLNKTVHCRTFHRLGKNFCSSAKKWFKFAEPSTLSNNLLFFFEIGVVWNPLNRVINNDKDVKMCKQIVCLLYSINTFLQSLLKINTLSFCWITV